MQAQNKAVRGASAMTVMVVNRGQGYASEQHDASRVGQSVHKREAGGACERGGCVVSVFFPFLFRILLI